MLLKRNITLLGTIRKNRTDRPKLSTKEATHSSKFFFTEITTLIYNIPNKNKNVILISTMHGDKVVSNRDNKKTQIILDYNATKGGVDTLDKLISDYTYKRKTNRWLIIVFHSILDVIAYNTFVLST